MLCVCFSETQPSRRAQPLYYKRSVRGVLAAIQLTVFALGRSDHRLAPRSLPADRHSAQRSGSGESDTREKAHAASLSASACVRKACSSAQATPDKRVEDLESSCRQPNNFRHGRPAALGPARFKFFPAAKAAAHEAATTAEANAATRAATGTKPLLQSAPAADSDWGPSAEPLAQEQCAAEDALVQREEFPKGTIEMRAGSMFTDCNSSGSSKCNLFKAPSQEGCDDCGIFLCLFAAVISNGKPFGFSQQDVAACRQRLVGC
ncbi:hypothetical protein cyc_04136 [Cyclospora cayetanensis]|uniref:Uncharacterized protein n=1 Tax=Cyclospora cayetanensis TaxID=88456 RepID=A0A1D3D261_9EIME|nr:hypothetical protein cyc_04136 [Cyclospora cayetanensis]